MNEKEELDIIKILGSRGTREILQYLNTHGKGRYINFKGFAATFTLNTRLRELMKLGLIEHHVIRIERKREWYTITEKGKKVLEYMEKIIEVVKEEGD